MIFLLIACNLGPVDDIAPGGSAPWSHPTDVACDSRDDTDTFRVDGFTYCGNIDGSGKIPVDDPILVPCIEANGRGRVVALFDGARARAYPIEGLLGRELVHDDWGDEPILVDY